MYSMAVSQFDDGAVERQRSVRNRQCSVYASRIRPAIAPLNLDAASAPGRVAPVPEVPPMPVSPRWDSLSNGSHLINHSPTSSPGHPLDDSWSELPYRPFVASPARPVFEQPSSAAADGAESPGKSPSKAASAWAASKPRTFRSDVRSSDGVAVENFSRPRKQSIRQPVIPEQCAPEPAVPRLANLSPTDLLYEIGSTASPQTPPWPAPRRPSASSCKSASPFSSPLGPPPPVELPEPRFARIRNAAGPPLTAARPPFAAGQRVDGNSASSPMAGSGAPPPWMADDELRSSFRSQLTASSAYGTALTERSSVLTKDSSVTSLYANADEPSLEDVMCMYEKGFADDDDDDDDDDVEEDDEDTDFDEGPAADPHNRHHHHHHHHHHYHHAGNPSASPARAADAARHLEPAAASDQGRPVTAMSAPEPGDQSADVDLMPPLPPPARSALDAEIRQSKMIFTSPAFTASVPALSAHVDLDVIAEKRDSGKSLDSEPSVSSDPASAANEGKKATATPLTSTPTSILSTSSTTTTKTTVSPPAIPPSPSSAAFRAAMEPEDPGSRDRYGFKKQNQFITREQYDSWNKGYTQYLARRHKKWATYLKECGLMTDRPIRFPPPNAKTKRFVRKGIPPDWRGAAWFYYAGGPAILAKHSGLYEKLLDREAKPIDVEAIERDLHRTFPDNIQFQPSPPAEDRPAPSADEPPIISSLRRVLHAFAVYNPRIGYCQSLNFLAGLLLLFVETEEQCFWLLNVITIIYLPGTHEMSLEGSKVDLGVLMTELRDTMPGVWDRIGGELESGGPVGGRPGTGKPTRKARPMLRRRDLPRLSTERLPPITLCMTAWFMSCYIGTLPIETTLRVWDVFFYEGSKTLFRIALSIFKSGESEIKAVSDPMEMFGVVQSLPRRMLDANALMETCFKRRNGFGHLSQDAIDERRQERRDRAQQDRSQQQQPAAPQQAAQQPGQPPAAPQPGGKPATGGSVLELETGSVHRKGTLFGRRRRDVSRSRATEL